jgi:hypothetical protein
MMSGVTVPPWRFIWRAESAEHVNCTFSSMH